MHSEVHTGVREVIKVHTYINYTINDINYTINDINFIFLVYMHLDVPLCSALFSWLHIIYMYICFMVRCFSSSTLSPTHITCRCVLKDVLYMYPLFFVLRIEKLIMT